MDQTSNTYIAGHRGMVGRNVAGLYDEQSQFHPRSPYGVAKIYGFWIIKNYREANGIYACNGILFNHESLRRGETFVTKKITMAVARIAKGKQDVLYMGNLNAQRDSGHAKDYIEAMWKIFQQEKPEDFVIATGKTAYVRDFITMAFVEVGIELTYESENENEIAKVSKCNHPDYQLEIGKIILKIDPEYYRPTEVDLLIGDPKKTQTQLDWTTKYDLQTLVKEMVESDLKLC